jgi:hypothetical protein
MHQKSELAKIHKINIDRIEGEKWQLHNNSRAL